MTTLASSGTDPGTAAGAEPADAEPAGPELAGPELAGPELAEIAEIESDLRARLRTLGADDDLVVILGLAAARRVPAAVLGRVRDDGTGALDLARCDVPVAEFARFQKLWYHFKVPYAQASLAWWYLFCLALGHRDDPAAALRQMTRWLGALSGSPATVLPHAGGLLGLPAGRVVVTEAETTDLAALAAAVRWNAPLVAVDDVRLARSAAAGGRVEVLAPGDRAGQDRGPLWLGRRPDLHGVTELARQAWDRLPGGERDELLAALGQRVTSIERVRFLLGEQLTDNRGVAAILARCRDAEVARWPEDDLALATVLWCWQTAGFALQELNQSFISLPALALFLTRRIRQYARRLGGPDGAVLDGAGLDGAGLDGAGLDGKGPGGTEEAARPDVALLAVSLAGLRGRVEQAYDRCLHFDGSNWERREFLLPRPAMCRVPDLPESLRAHLLAWTGAEFPGRAGTLAAWDRFIQRALDAGSSPTRAMLALATWSANASDLYVDNAVFTVPLGCKLDEPWTMEFTDLFCYTAFRDGFRPEDFGINNDLVGIQNVMGQRMRYNAVKKAQNYAPVRRFPPQGFNLPDISVAEDANHAGHTAAGVRLACRVPISISYRDRVWNGLADVRLNRSLYRPDNRFSPRDLITASRYAHWAKGIADATYRRGLGFAEKWGNKVRDLET